MSKYINPPPQPTTNELNGELIIKYFIVVITHVVFKSNKQNYQSILCHQFKHSKKNCRGRQPSNFCHYLLKIVDLILYYHILKNYLPVFDNVTNKTGGKMNLEWPQHSSKNVPLMIKRRNILRIFFINHFLKFICIIFLFKLMVCFSMECVKYCLNDCQLHGTDQIASLQYFLLVVSISRNGL